MRGNRIHRYVSATIAAGETVSDTVDVGAETVVGLFIPTDWVTANLTFHGAYEAGGDLFEVETLEVAGSAFTITSVTEETYIPIRPIMFAGLERLQITSSQAQTNGAVIVLSCRPVE